LTPPHITDLFCELAGITKDNSVFGNCCGIDDFLISVMDKMVKLAKGNLQKIEHIKKQQLVGIEYQDNIFNFCCSNMILHEDGKTNIIKGDCFEKIDKAKEFKPTIGLLNSSYSTSINELKFLLNNLEALEKNGYMIAILSMICALYQKGEGYELKQKLLDLHTLEAALSMPDDLFYQIGTNICIMIFKAHQPHQEEYKT